jgi:16S rRNA (cytosine967-C5)-methyltransferase
VRPAARLKTIAELLPQTLSERQAADRTMQQWGRKNRFAGSKDRRDISDRLFAILRHYGMLTARLGGDDPLLVTMLATHVLADMPLPEVLALADGSQYAPAPISPADEKTLTHAAAAPAEARADKLSVPAWLLDDIEAQLGAQTDNAMGAMLQRAALDVRVNLLKADRDGAQAALLQDDIEAAPHPHIDTALRITGTAQITMSAAYREGLVDVQDAGAQAVAQICGAKAFDTVMDYCAGAGGKALALAAQMENKGRLLVHDAIATRMRGLPERVLRAGVNIVETVAPEHMPDFEGQCDLVVADVPCSGAGRWRRAPETKWRLTPDALADLHIVQADILQKASTLVRPGGRLAYITCSVLASENNRQIDLFLEENQGFEEVETNGPHGAAARHMLHPFTTETDGLFVAVLQRSAQSDGA